MRSEELKNEIWELAEVKVLKYREDIRATICILHFRYVSVLNNVQTNITVIFMNSHRYNNFNSKEKCPGH
ncbi:hypothetical protein ACH3XW_3480 [Acanthocheilonema viteae]